ncbi:MAG: hypothetical protein JY451_02235 [Erythrobacter sp.]|nr:MAG: hypothetical protein JY451_02235 [Erythrobacter sp.]
MTHSGLQGPSRLRRIGWLAALGLCAALYVLLHIKVTAVHADVVQAERRIVALEEQKLLLETEFLTRANQVQLAAWNRVDFGFTSPTADQFIAGPRELAQFGGPPAVGAPPPIRLAGLRSGEDVPEFPRLVSPLTGEPVDADLLGGAESDSDGIGTIAVAGGPLRMPIAGLPQAVTASAAGFTQR